MAASTIPYIGSKISLISNSEIRYEGILYTINTQESTIALQSVRSFGTEGRKYPEIPPSSEIYDFIIFRGQDIKDLTVLEGKGAHSSPQLNDPAIMSMNQRPPGGPPSKGLDKGASDSKGKGKGKWGKESSSTSKGWGKSDGGKGDGGYGDRSWGQSKGGGKGGYSTGKSSWDYGYHGDSGGGGGKGGKSKGKDKDEGKGKKGKDGGKSYDGKGKKGDGKKGDRDDGGKKGGKKGDRGGQRGGRTGGGASGHGIPIGELLPQEDAAVKRECAEDFDVENANTKFEKLKEEEELNKDSATLGYDKAKSFFDSISCEATERASTADRQKVDRDKARQFDRETFGNTGRPPRPTGGGRSKGGKGKGK